MHTTALQVRFSELDPYGHVNHAAYLDYLEVGRVEALEAVGVPLGWLQDEGFHVPVVGLEVRYRRSARLGDRLEVVSGLAELRTVSARWDQRILVGGEEIVAATVRCAVTDREGRPRPGPEGWLERLAPLRA